MPACQSLYSRLHKFFNFTVCKLSNPESALCPLFIEISRGSKSKKYLFQNISSPSGFLLTFAHHDSTGD